MELFYSNDISGGLVRLDEEESGHCVRVLRHRTGDEIDIIDGRGALLRCRVVSDRPKSVEAEIVSRIDGWNAHPYRLTMAVCPTKNIDRYEWFAEKAAEMGVDVIAPVIGEHSERRSVKTQRLEKIVLSAAKQSLKSAVPAIAEPVSVRDFVLGCEAESPVDGLYAAESRAEGFRSEKPYAAGFPSDESSCGSRIPGGAQSPLKLIACCFEDAGHPRKSIKEALGEHFDAALRKSGTAAGVCKPAAYGENTVREGRPAGCNVPEIVILVGPEGDFSQEELRIALERGFIPVHLGPSRLRTETAALLCVEAVYSAFTL